MRISRTFQPPKWSALFQTNGFWQQPLFLKILFPLLFAAVGWGVGIAQAQEIYVEYPDFLRQRDDARLETPASVASLENHFEANDFDFLKEYALIFLHPDDCQRFKNPQTCHEIVHNPKLGAAALQKIIDFPFQNPKQQSDIGYFQYQFSKIMRKDVLRKKENFKNGRPDPDSDDCRVFIYYLLKARENLYQCLEREIGGVYKDAFCTSMNLQVSRYFNSSYPKNCSSGTTIY